MAFIDQNLLRKNNRILSNQFKGYPVKIDDSEENEFLANYFYNK